ncbi:MAG: MarR family transcriptional regulator [Thermaerobacter sp.]|nr:MarR family transcriptional regulator [Thermaerobacter sp.]
MDSRLDNKAPSGEACLQAMGAIARFLKADSERRLSAHGVHAGQQFVLQCLWTEDGLTPGELAERIGIEGPTVVRMVNRMTTSGLVFRSPDPEDARRVRVHLTQRGWALEQVIPELLRQRAETATAGLSREERQELLGFLRHMARNLGMDL